MSVLLDTHSVVWLIGRIQDLGSRARDLIETAGDANAAFVSAFSFWEVAMLSQRGRLYLPQPPTSWRQRVLDMGIQEIAVSGEIGILAAELENFPRDPADRVIAATALTLGATLITADESVLNWQGNLLRHDARE